MGKFVKDVKRFANYTVFSSKAELKSEVADSFLSWLWWFLDPLLFMFVYSFIAITVFKSNVQYFCAFVFLGLNTWNFFNKTVKSSVKLVAGNKMIVTKVYIPKFMFILQKMGVYGFKMVVSNLLTIVIMFIYRVPISWRMLYFIPLTIFLILLTFAVSTIMIHFGVFVEDLFNIVNVVLQLGFYLSGIFYSIENKLPKKYSDMLLAINPIGLVITDLRRVVLYNQDPHWLKLAVWTGICLLVAIIGTKMIYKYENSYVKVI